MGFKTFTRFGPPQLARGTHSLAGVLRWLADRKLTAKSFLPIVPKLEKIASQKKKIIPIMNVFAPFTIEPNGPFDCTNTCSAFARLEEQNRQKPKWFPEAIEYAEWMHRVHLPAIELWVTPAINKKENILVKKKRISI
ncbi:hypothetical protein [Pajaroellobacter abortibovis]|uniref:hypothetical protein n=1 Tax=Pajaroellobacter abortibovis TaxID=1882918 RepID=UPI0012EB6385|nr:hypothetical protein [Pajaroellobacter abortibovis]